MLYDVTATYFEGRTCPLARYDYSRDHRRDRPQIVFGLLCASNGCPVAAEVFEANACPRAGLGPDQGAADPATVANQVEKLKQRFRGMLTDARIETVLKPAGLDWITSLRAPAVKALAEAGTVRLSLFDERDLAEVISPDFPGERLVVCRNPLLGAERTRKRDDLLAAAETELARIATAVNRKNRPLRGADQIGMAVGKVLDRHKMAKHFSLTITDDSFSFARHTEAIAAEARLDGIYVIRTSVPAEQLTAPAAVAWYKSLSRVERAFRSIKTVDLEVRPIHHRLADRVRAPLLLCMLAYYVEWHLREALAAILFDDHEPTAADAQRSSVVAPPRRSAAARRKAARMRTGRLTGMRTSRRRSG